MLSKITVLLLLLAMLVCMGSLCDMSSHNGPYPWNNGNPPIDTTHISNLQYPETISIAIKVREFDFTMYKHISVVNAAVFLYNANEEKITDTNGYSTFNFITNTKPFKYHYEVTKDGYKKQLIYGWDTIQAIQHTLTIEKVK